MPPKEAKVSDDAFLAACFRNLKDKPTVDFNALAEETSMSQGGAANKLRAIWKKFEGEGTPAWMKNGDASKRPKSSPANKRKSNSRVKDEVKYQDEDEASDVEASPKKKSKSTPAAKKSATTKNAHAKDKDTATATDGGDDGNTTSTGSVKVEHGSGASEGDDDEQV